MLPELEFPFSSTPFPQCNSSYRQIHPTQHLTAPPSARYTVLISNRRRIFYAGQERFGTH
nr:MAG TPA: hypothetical protein [Caudoviricetes sp.]